MAGVWDLAPAADVQPATGDPGIWGAAPAIGAAVRAPGPQEAQDLSETVLAGIQGSATGLAFRRELPSLMLKKDASWYERAASNAAGMLTDLPLSIAGAIGGGVAGSEVPVVGTAVGGMAGAFAAPMALREALMTAYSQNHARNWGDVWDIAMSAMKGGTKGAVIGGLTGGVGKAALLAAPEAGTFAKLAISSAAELPTMTTAAAALDGRMPTAQDFLDNAILLGGTKGAIHVASNLRAIYAETGKLPGEITADSLKDPELRAIVTAEQPGPVRPGEPRPTFNPIPAKYAELALQSRIDRAIQIDPRNDIVGRTLTDLMRGDEKTNLADLFKDLPDAVKMEYIGDTETAQGVLRVIENMYRAEVDKATRGSVPIRVTMEAGMRKLAAGIDPHIIGEGESPSLLAARTMLLGAATENAKRVMTELAAKPEDQFTTTDKLRLAASMEGVQQAYVDVRGSAAETGRALNVLRQIKYNKGLMGDAEAITNLYKKNFGNLTWNHIAQMASMLKDPAQMAAFGRDFSKATTGEKVMEAWKAAILSGPQTHMANMMGNLAKLAIEIPETALSTTITALRRFAQGDPMSWQLYKAKAFAPLHGLVWGWRDAGLIASEALKGEGSHLEKADVYRTAIEGPWGKFVRLPFRLLNAEDVLFRTIAERGKAYEMAVERALKEGFDPQSAEYRDKLATYTMQPDFGLEAADGAVAMKAIRDAGAEAVFSQRLGPTMEKIQAAIQGHPIQYIVPFIRTPTNLLSWAVQHSPGFMLSTRWWNDFKAGGALRDRAITRVMVGSAMALTAYSMVSEGNLTGGGMFDPEQRRAKIAAGWQPYSIKIGDKYYSYQRIEPVSRVLGLAADYFEMQHKLSEDDRAKGTLAMLAMFGNATISTTYLSGIASTFQALTDPTRYGERWYEMYAASLVPKAIGQAAMLHDPYKRQVDDVSSAIQSQVPFLREKLMPIRDIWGEPMANEKAMKILPIQVTEASKDKVRTEAQRLELAISDVSKFVAEAGPIKVRERTMQLTPKQLDLMREVSGKSAMELLAPIVNSPAWDHIPQFAQAEVYKRIISATRTNAKWAVLPADSTERQEMRQKILDEVTQQVRAAGG